MIWTAYTNQLVISFYVINWNTWQTLSWTLSLLGTFHWHLSLFDRRGGTYLADIMVDLLGRHCGGLTWQTLWWTYLADTVVDLLGRHCGGLTWQTLRWTYLAERALNAAFRSSRASCSWPMRCAVDVLVDLRTSSCLSNLSIRSLIYIYIIELVLT